MKTLTFKSNINCSGCLSKVSPILNKNDQITNWNVDLENPNKILTVETNSLEHADIRMILEEIGFSVNEV